VNTDMSNAVRINVLTFVKYCYEAQCNDY